MTGLKNFMTHTSTVRIYWEDTDAGGVVYHANYLKFFERARTEWLRAAGVEQQAMMAQTGSTFVVTDIQMRYLAPARLDDTLFIKLQLIEQRQASLQIEHQAWRGDTLLVQGRVRIGWVDVASLRPQRMPAQVLAALTVAVASSGTSM